MNNCQKCGANDWATEKQQSLNTFKRCNNCSYSPAFEKVEAVDAKTWVESIAKEHLELQENAHQLEQELHDIENPSNLQIGNLNKAKRLLEGSDNKMTIAECLSNIIETTESGLITIMIPNLGAWQFEWGAFNLLNAIGKTKDV